MAVDDLLGALWLPGDGKVNPTDLTMALARGARVGRRPDRGDGCGSLGVDVEDGPAGRRVTAVRTDHGDVEAEVVVNCAGQWAKALADQVGVTVPLHSAEHFYVVTDAIEGVHPDLPIMRDPDGWTYFKEEVGGLVVGGFEPEAKPWRSPDTIPHPFEFQLLEEDWEHFSMLMDEALRRIPALGDTGIRKFYNGPESFTPDNQFVMGEAPGLRGYFVCAGLNSVGIASAGGAGRALAEWIVEGEPTTDLVAVDIRRFAEFNGNNRWLKDRVAEVLGLHYAVPWPNREMETARPFRCSPVHDRLAAAGASFGSKMGWERPNFFAPEGESPELVYSWGRPSWLPWSAAEHRATREAVAVFDQTSFSKYVVDGPGALEALQWVCANDVDADVGRAVYTPLLNRRGAYESDLTVTRTGEQEFLLVSSSATTVRDVDWIRRNVPGRLRRPGARRDHGVLRVRRDGAALARPAPAADRQPTSARRRSRSPPAAASRSASATVRATRMTYVGELGWELMVPVEFAAGVHDLLLLRGAGRRASRTPATTRSTRCGWRRASARSDASSRPTTRRSRPGWSSPPRSRATSRSSGGRRSRRTATGSAEDGPQAAAGLVRARGPRPDALGRRAGAPRRRAGRTGHQRRLGRHRRRCRRPRLRPRRRPGHPVLAGRRRRSRSTSRGTGSPPG